MKSISITGRAIYNGTEGGFWGIESNGKKYEPINMPEQLKTHGARVKIKAQTLEGASSMNMWGTIIRITSFETLGII